MGIDDVGAMAGAGEMASLRLVIAIFALSQIGYSATWLFKVKVENNKACCADDRVKETPHIYP